MAYQRIGETLTLPADGAIASNRIVVKSTTGAAQSTANQANPIGVTVEGRDGKNQVGIQTSWIVQITAGEVVTQGDYVISDSTGSAVTAVPGATGVIAYFVGVALTTTTAAGQLVDVLLTKFVGHH